MGVPGLEDADQVEARGGPLAAARAAADLARDHEGAQAALGLVVGRADAGDAHELEELAAMPPQPLGQRLARVARRVGVAAGQGVRAVLQLPVGARTPWPRSGAVPPARTPARADREHARPAPTPAPTHPADGHP